MDQSSIVFISIISAAGLAALVLAAFFVARAWKHRRRSLEMDDMEGHEFEYFCADLLRDKGFLDVEVTRGSGDFGVDILAEKDGASVIMPPSGLRRYRRFMRAAIIMTGWWEW